VSTLNLSEYTSRAPECVLLSEEGRQTAAVRILDTEYIDAATEEIRFSLPQLEVSNNFENPEYPVDSIVSLDTTGMKV
jgi:hypothetical protein